jgi:hypothetical protein
LTKKALGELKQTVFDQGCQLATMQAELANTQNRLGSPRPHRERSCAVRELTPTDCTIRR